ncbi:hypothetical protein EUX98_g2026 [Antrodiella citrinella]|uniref:SH3 domain-containing protein n=1 Tax=Antrodiella citrinella TaxID=2447956 RepID=A0A4V6S1X5_9APHY|nr:hypothetical protein EUX98_g2026 [Antrodiella citrinella]
MQSAHEHSSDSLDNLASDDPSQDIVMQVQTDNAYPSDEEHSVLEDDSDGEERDDYMDDDDGSSSLSIPNESIDFDLVYALHSFAATVEGQANVVKGDSLVLMDDSNSYWWLVRVLKTQEVGYIPAENIETPFERLARLNKHRNVDLAAATQAELQATRDRLRDDLSSRAGSNQATPSPTPGAHGARSRTRERGVRGVAFTPALSVHRYPPAVWNEEDEEDEDVEWDDEGYEDEDPDLAEEQERERELAQGGPLAGMEPDDGMSWEDGAVLDVQARKPAEAPGAPEQAAQKQPMQIDTSQQQQVSPVGLSPQKDASQAAMQRQAYADRLTIIPDASPPPTGIKTMDPSQAAETRKISITPAVAREPPADTPAQVQQQQQQGQGPLLPSAILQQQQEERKKTREEIEALEEASRKKVAKGKPGEQGKPPGGAKLRKERIPEPVSSTDDESNKKKKGGVFGGLFGRRKDKGKDKGSSISESGSINSTEIILGRESEESGRSNQQVAVSAAEISPVTASAKQQQQLLQRTEPPKGVLQSPQRPVQQAQNPETPPHSSQTQLSQHASQLRQRDQQQQALYQQYLNRSPSSPPQTQPSYGLQSASAVMPGGNFVSSPSSVSAGLGVATSRPRPGSLVLSPQTMEGVGLPDLSVVRVFAGHNLQTEATFKTVLLNSGTTASDLVRQAIQRFRLSVGENDKDYYLTIKQVEGSSAMLLPHEHPLVVFEGLVEAALELPKVKRSSVGSISSVASNLSMHPAIKKLSMNDFTDDSAVKFYLNRRGDGRRDAATDEEGDETLMAESTFDEDPDTPRSPGFFGNNVAPDRFSSPSSKFALQLVIHPEDLPDDMVFDPLTEAIVFKGTLRDRTPNAITSPTGVPQHQRKKIFVLPKNITVAEVTEMGLDRFGILDGVVDGGDEVEDKLAKRRSSTRVRYGLAVDVNGKERELPPSSRIIDAYPRPPQYRTFERRTDNKRRSVDSASLLGSAEDINPDDPIFILRRAVSYRTSSRRMSAPLDEIALQRAQRESMSSSSTASDSTAGPDTGKQRQLSKQEVIAAQRAASRANQRAILSAQANSARGLDVILPGNAMIRSSRYDVDDRMRYSYVEPDGETYDISDIVESEWRGEAGPHRERADAARDDLLHGVLSRGKDGLGARLDRVLSKVRHEKSAGRAHAQVSSEQSESLRTRSPSLYSTAEGGTDTHGSRSATPNAHTLNARSPTPTAAGQRVLSPVNRSKPEVEPRRRASHDRNQSISSLGSDASGYMSVGSPPNSSRLQKETTPKPVYIPNDDFGFDKMMAVIELRGKLAERIHLPTLDPADELLFGRELNMQMMHPRIREVYSGALKDLEEMDKGLDELLELVAHTF